MSEEGWDHIRTLDEAENWQERNAVISKDDHQTHTNWAREVVEDMVDNAHHKSATPSPTDGTTPSPPALHSADAPPTQSSSRDFDYMKEMSDDDFQGSAAQIDIDYLEKISGKTNPQASALTRESLYVKFDPLVGGGPGRTHRSPHQPRGSRNTHLSSNDLMAVDTPPRDPPPAVPQSHAVVDLLSSSPARILPHTPSDNPDLATQPVHHTPSSLSTSHTAATATTTSSSSPVPSSVSPRSSRPPPSSSSATSAVGRGTGTLVEVLKYGDEDMVAAVERARNEERVKYEAQMQKMKEDLSRKVASAQKECLASRNEIKKHIGDKQRLESELEQLREALKTNENMQEIVHRHYDDLRTKVKDIEQQRESAIRDFEGLDKSFADLHQRYLRLKQSSDNQQQQEKTLVNQITRLEENCVQTEEKLRQLQADSTQQTNEFNSQHESMKKQHSQDVALTKAKVRKLELQVESLNRALDEKVREKEGLTQLCDELLAQINPS